MGAFDSVVFTCPACSKGIHVHSKAGECSLNQYKPTEVPLEIVTSIAKQDVYCDSCGTGYRIMKMVPIETLPMMLVPLSEIY